MSVESREEKIKTAVITGKHPFDVPAFHTAFRSMPEIDFFPQHMEDFVADIGERRAEYDVLLFFNFHQETPGSSDSPGDEATKRRWKPWAKASKVWFILHHALLAYPDWPLWASLVGIQATSWRVHMDIDLNIQVGNPRHPITQGLSDWTMLDETYVVGEPDANSEILLFTHEPKSMRSIAWTRRYKNARVFLLPVRPRPPCL